MTRVADEVPSEIDRLRRIEHPLRDLQELQKRGCTGIDGTLRWWNVMQQAQDRRPEVRRGHRNIDESAAGNVQDGFSDSGIYRNVDGPENTSERMTLPE